MSMLLFRTIIPLSVYETIKCELNGTNYASILGQVYCIMMSREYERILKKKHNKEFHDYVEGAKKNDLNEKKSITKRNIGGRVLFK